LQKVNFCKSRISAGQHFSIRVREALLPGQPAAAPLCRHADKRRPLGRSVLTG
jgi:hypothetical protein